MKETKIERMSRFLGRMAQLGFSYSETKSLLRIERTLSRWAELECGDGNDHGSWAIERDEATEKPFMVHHHYLHGRGTDYTTRTTIPDRERGALARVERILASHPAVTYYHQGDPRGCALYLVRKSDLQPGEQLDCVYTRGIAVCVD